MPVCTVYVIYGHERLHPDQAIIFSLFFSLDLLRLLPLKGDLTPLLLKDHPSKPGNQMAFVQYVETRCRREGVCLSQYFRSCIATSIAGEAEGYPVRREIHIMETLSRTYISIDFIRVPIFRVQTRG